MSDKNAAANRARSFAVAARRIGCTVEEYEQNRASGMSWCTSCRQWHLLVEFAMSKGRPDTSCKTAKAAEKAERDRKRRVERQALRALEPVEEPREVAMWPVLHPTSRIQHLVTFASDKACDRVDGSVFFPEDDEGFEDPEKVAEAKAICRRCAVEDSCLTAALQRDEPVGVWGGMSTSEREAIIRKDWAA